MDWSMELLFQIVLCIFWNWIVYIVPDLILLSFCVDTEVDNVDIDTYLLTFFALHCCQFPARFRNIPKVIFLEERTYTKKDFLRRTLHSSLSK
jgi:hypothetical protein